MHKGAFVPADVARSEQKNHTKNNKQTVHLKEIVNDASIRSPTVRWQWTFPFFLSENLQKSVFAFDTFSLSCWDLPRSFTSLPRVPFGIQIQTPAWGWTLVGVYAV